MNHSTLLATRLATIAATATLTACAAAADTTTSSTVPKPTSTTDASAATTQAVLDDWAAAGRGGVTVALAGDDDDLQLLAAGTDGPHGGTLAPDAPFRVGSLTKTFVAVMMLQFVADGTMALDDLVTRHAPELAVAQGVTIRQLLAHRSGIPEHTDGELAPAVMTDPARTWTPNDVLDLVSEQPRDFPPGEQFAYSNTNYIIAGLLLEPHQHIPRRQPPVAHRRTARAHLDLPRPRRPAPADRRLLTIPARRHHRRLPLPGTRNSGRGSRRSRLQRRGSGHVHAGPRPRRTHAVRRLRRDAQGPPGTGHSLGIFPSDPPSPTGISNAGAIPGFSAYMQYDPVTENLFVLLLNDDNRSPEPLGNALLTILNGT